MTLMRMNKAKRTILALYCTVFTFIVIAQTPGDNIFNSSIVHEVNIDFEKADYWETLLANFDKRAELDTNIYIPCTLTFDSLTLDSVGVRLKGQSSIGHVGQKKPIKFSFNKFVKGRFLDGLKQLNLNNSFLDPTMMREKLMLDFLNENDLPAPRCTYAKVSFNGDFVGLYKIVEEVDKRFLSKYFGNNDGNLYKGDPNGTLRWEGDAQWNYYDNIDLKTNEKANDWDDLIEFINDVNNSSVDKFYYNMEKQFNTSSFIVQWAANNLFGNFDSYFYLPHNYYFYHNEETDKFDWITWDVSLAFGVFPFVSQEKAENVDLLHIGNNGKNKPLTANMLAIDDYRNAYLNAICSYVQHDFTEEKLWPKIDSLAEIIRPFLPLEPADNQMYTSEEFEKNINYDMDDRFGKYIPLAIPGLKSYITNRRNYAMKRLCELKWSCAKGALVGNDITVSPNPTTDEIKVEFSISEPHAETASYRITNLLGQIVFEQTVDFQSENTAQNFSFQNLPAGLYILSAGSGCLQQSKKIVVIK
ncbi:MAG: hypothetical protein COA57_16105 [Flavobacteriales bacterium]|nr:MAG: hypothetical protein COA57_16105 [Flavobacteriales bacterium]